MSPARGMRIDYAGLRWLFGFRWLRAGELGGLIWPHQKDPRKSGERLIRKWREEERDWVITRSLGDAGTAYLLSAAGAAALNQMGVGDFDAASGKDWGEQEKDEVTGKDVWRPPRTWRHELRQSSFAVQLQRLHPGWQIIPERLLRYPGLKERVPDLLIVDDEGHVHWCEIERTRKSGKHMDDMAATLVEVALKGKSLEHINAGRATCAMLAASTDEIDERGLRIHHGTRVAAAIRKIATKDVTIMMAPFEVDALGVVRKVNTGSVTIYTDANARELAAVGDWQDCDDGWCRAEWTPGMVMATTPSDTGVGWAWMVTHTPRSPDGRQRGQPIEVDSGVSKTLDAAREAAMRVARRPVPLTLLVPE